MRKMKSPASTKKRILISALVAIPILAIGVYVFLSFQAWQTANTVSTAATSAIKESVAKNIAAEKLPVALPDSVQTVLNEYSDSISRGACTLSPAFEWQSGLWFMKDTRTTCLDAAAATTTFVESLKSYQAYMNKQIAAAKVIEGAIEALGTDYAGIASQWTNVPNDPAFATTDENDPFFPVVAQVKTTSTALAAAFTALQDAVTKEDKAAFDAAETGLTAAYAQLATIDTVAYEIQEKLVKDVLATYQTL